MMQTVNFPVMLYTVSSLLNQSKLLQNCNQYHLLSINSLAYEDIIAKYGSLENKSFLFLGIPVIKREEEEAEVES